MSHTIDELVAQIDMLRECIRALSRRLAAVELELAARSIERGEFDRDDDELVD
jgi:hypothetical protein